MVKKRDILAKNTDIYMGNSYEENATLSPLRLTNRHKIDNLRILSVIIVVNQITNSITKKIIAKKSTTH